MNKNNRYPSETYQIIDEYEQVHIGLRDTYKYKDIDKDNFKATDIEVLFFMICMEPESVCYGTAVGAFVYKDGNIYRFDYNIHTPHSKGPRISNQMTHIDHVVLDTRRGITSVKFEETVFGAKAFWVHTPMDILDPEAKSLRELMISLQLYCRQQNLCGKLCELDKKHKEWENRRKVAVAAINSKYGINSMINTSKPGNSSERLSKDELKLKLNTGSGVLREQKTPC